MASVTDDKRLPLPGSWRPLRLATLVGLRWLAVGGQTVGLLFVSLGLGFPLPLMECLGLVALSVLLNLWLIFRSGAGHRPTATVATVQLAYDCVQLGGLLALTGGLQNPFSLLLLAPVSVSATTLPQRSTFMLAALVIAIASLTAVWHLPLPWHPQNHIVFDRVYVIGIWVSLLCGVTFIAAYTNRVAHEARQLADALAATEIALSRHEQLNALDGLAAAAAHELGTPLSTIALAAKEMRSDIPPGHLAEDVELIISQTARCRAILAKLRNLGADGGDPFAALPLGELIAEVAKPYEGLGRTISITTENAAGPDPVFRRNVGLLYGLGNLIENAVHFAKSRVLIDAGWDKIAVTLAITDDGPGFPPDLIARLGEPYLTTRARAAEDAAAAGLGLGIFIAKTLLERTGARLSFENQTPEGGALVSIVWPRKLVETQKASGF
ncbi:MAG: ActS/PrrB/RegB family redox-sensitive histidine kinase [Devosia sp.]|nr:ActS/PrrB/RegB family redox-sensitive histidine kinase [Devosia sp.]